MQLSPFQQNIENLTCRRIIEENHNDSIICLVEEKGHGGICRYAASISPLQVNIYDTENKNSNLGFFSHYVVEKTQYFKGGYCTCASWLFPHERNKNDSILAVGTDKGEVFLMSCIECRMTSIFSAPSEQRITIISSPSSMPNLLVATNSSGNLFVWDVITKELVFSQTDIIIYDMVCGNSSVLLYLNDNNLAILDLTTFVIRSLQHETQSVFADDNYMAMLCCHAKSTWILLFSTRMISLHQETFETHIFSLPSTLPSYMNSNRVSITRDCNYLTLAENQRVRIIDLQGNEMGEIVDNYGLGAQNSKDQNPYRKLPLSSCILHPQAKYAVAIEENRVLRFDMIDPNTSYVSHVIFPHPVEDMFIFYDHLNAEPLLYLNSKIKKN